MKKVLLVILAGLLTVVFSTQSMAAWGVRGSRRDRIFRKLDLTREQKDKFRAINVSAQREEMKKMTGGLKVELGKDNPDRAKIHELIRKMGQKRTEMQIRRMDSLLDLRKILTPEQRKKFSEGRIAN